MYPYDIQRLLCINLKVTIAMVWNISVGYGKVEIDVQRPSGVKTSIQLFRMLSIQASPLIELFHKYYLSKKIIRKKKKIRHKVFHYFDYSENNEK